MSKYIAIFLVFATTAWSCSKSSNQQPVLAFSKIDSINGQYLNTIEFHSDQWILGGFTYFSHNGALVTKRIGALLPNSPFSPQATDAVYDTILAISGNELVLETVTNSALYNIFPNKRILTLNNGLILKKITYSDNGDGNNDTIYYNYDINNRLQYSMQFFPLQVVKKNYTFDGAGNLSQIATFNAIKQYYPVYSDSVYEEFGGYDNKPNTLKGSCLWQDLLYRTLSNNNFTTYTYIWAPGYQNSYNWVLHYDSNGNVDFSK